MLTSRSLRFSALVGVLVLAAVGCSSDSDDDSGSSSSTTKPGGAPLVGTQWVLSDSTDLRVPLSGVTVTAAFADGRIAGNSACNSYTGPYTTSGSTMTIGPDIAGTKMACEPRATAVEKAYLARLPQVTEYSIDGRTLTLKDDDTTLLVYEASDGAKAIVGKWTATGYYTGTAIQSVVVGSTLTADFTATEVAGESGCNAFSGGYEVSGSTITMGPFRSTLKACVDPALQTQEQQYLAALEAAATFSVAGDQLELFRADGGIAVTFEKTATATG